MKFVNAALATWRAGVALCILPCAMAFAQGLPPQLALPKPPPLPHEANPNTWPQPDYFGEALELTGFKPSLRAASLANGLNTAAASARFVVLPIQTQAFGFSPVFRAIIGAHLDRELERIGVAATRQPDIADAYGPLVRRLDETQVVEAIKDHPQQKLLIVYLGHDGINQVFVTLVVRDAQRQIVSHQTLTLPEDTAAAEGVIARVLPALVKEAGVTPAAPESATLTSQGCGQDAWSFETSPQAMAPTQRACHAIVIATLLPSYERYRLSGADESVSAAKLAWLAQAFVYAAHEGGGPNPREAIRALAAHQLGNLGGATSTNLLAYRQTSDPVVSRLARLLTLEDTSRTSPSVSSREAGHREVDRITEGLPSFAAALVQARADLPDAFAQVDFCAIERSYPAALMRTSCRDSVDLPSAHAKRSASAREILLYQEWRLAWYHADLRYYAATQGNRARADEILRGLPADVAQHPYLQRLRYELIDLQAPSGSFDDQLKRMREAARRVVQTTVDLQRSDPWLAGHSLSEHTWTHNLNIINDAEVTSANDADARLVYVLRFDRFGSMPGGASKRKPGDGAYFLIQPASRIRFVSMMANLPMPPASAPAGPPPAPYKPRLFPPRQAFFETPAMPELEADLERSPMDMDLRVVLAVAQLKAGGNVADARRLINARPNDERSDYRVSESHAWAGPAHAFYFAGEPAAARAYYERVTKIGTGSDSDLLARVRVQLIDGHLRAALDATAARLRRYDSDYARRDLVGLSFMLNKPDDAWAAFLPRGAATEAFQLWLGAYTGHRIAGANLATIDKWLTEQGMDEAQIEYADLPSLYLHLNAVTDRSPTEADIAFLKRPRGKRTYVSRQWAASALLIRSALEDAGQSEAFSYAASALVNRSGNDSDLFVLPTYTWVAQQATDGKDDALADVRAATLRSSFERILAKSMLLALEGQTAESINYFTAARYGLSALGQGEMVNRAIPAPYQFALGGYLMFRKTRNTAYREQALRFVQAYQKVHPFLGWLYSMEALLDERPKERFTAACRAQFLDPQSYFLKLANVGGLTQQACVKSLWK